MEQHHTVQMQRSYSKKGLVAFGYGEIVEIREELGRLRVEWKIPDFLSLGEEKSVFSPSSIFLAGYLLGINPSKTRYRIRLFLGYSPEPYTYTVGIRQVDGTVDESCSTHGVVSFSRDVLLKKQSKWLPSGVLTVTSQMQRIEASKAEVPTGKGPEVELLWDSKKVKANRLEPIYVSDDSDTEDDETSAEELKRKSMYVSDDSDAEDDPERSDRTHDSREMRTRLADVLAERLEEKITTFKCIYSVFRETQKILKKSEASDNQIIAELPDYDNRAVKNRLNLVSKGTQTEDLPSVDKEKTEQEQLEAKSISKLTKHLGELLLGGPDHDITIKVKNRPFKAHKSVLRARSPVFASMFTHDMKENASGVVSIDDCDPDVFGQFLEHVYTGTFEMDSAKSACALYYAADKYDFQELKEACVRYLSESFETTTVCDVIKMAKVHGHKGLLQMASLFFKRNLEEILKTVEWQIFLQGNTTIANELLTHAVMSRSKGSEEKKIDCPSCSVKRT